MHAIHAFTLRLDLFPQTLLLHSLYCLTVRYVFVFVTDRDIARNGTLLHHIGGAGYRMLPIRRVIILGIPLAFSEIKLGFRHLFYGCLLVH